MSNNNGITYSLICGYLKSNNGFGINNSLPWPMIKKDMNFFKKTTLGSNNNNVIIMGRKTYESIGRPLPRRVNIVITRNKEYTVPEKYSNRVYVVHNFNSALKVCYNLKQEGNLGDVFVIGGESIYRYAIKRPDCRNLYITEIDGEYKVDTYFPEIPKNYNVVSDVNDTEFVNDNNINLTFKIYENTIQLDNNSCELEYIRCINNVLQNGKEINNDRTGTGTIATFCETVKYDIEVLNPSETDPTKIRYKIPLLTTKKMYTNGIIYELMWFLLGNTNSKWLEDRNTNIWKDNSTEDFLRGRGLDYDEGQLGPVYGHQWTNWGGDWRTGTNGINQIKNIIENLKTNPYSRRHVFTGWNVADLNKMALPPCHMTYTFTVIDNKLYCKVDLRSNDMFLGHPYNVCSAAILTILIGRAAGIEPAGIGLSMTNCHIYKNHINQCKTQICRTPLQLPEFQLNYDINSWEDIVNLCEEYNDNVEKPLNDVFKITQYSSYPILKGKMAI